MSNNTNPIIDTSEDQPSKEGHKPSLEERLDEFFKVENVTVSPFTDAELKELPLLFQPVPAMDESFLPEDLRSWLVTIARNVCVPLEFTAVTAVTVIGSIVGKQIGIYPKQRDTGFYLSSNLWSMIVARPGQKKTPAMNAVLSPLKRIIAEAEQEYNDIVKDHIQHMASRELDLKEYKKEIKSLDKKIAKTPEDKDILEEKEALQKKHDNLSTDLKTVKEAKLRRYMTSDATYEKVGEILSENKNGILVCRDELSGFLANLSKASCEGARSFYIEGWNGTGSYTFDRIMRGTKHIESMCISILGGIQPGVIQKYISSAIQGDKHDDGLLQRFQLLIFPSNTPDWVLNDEPTDSAETEKIYTIFKSLSMFDKSQLSFMDFSERPGLRFTANAQRIYNDFLNANEIKVRSEEYAKYPALASHMSKYNSLMPKLALIFHLLDVVTKNTEHSGAVSENAANLAMKWCELLEAHARKMYADEINPELRHAHALAKKIEQGHVTNGTSIRDIYRNCWTGLKNSSETDLAIKILQELNWVRLSTTQQGRQGAPSTILLLHPELRKD